MLARDQCVMMHTHLADNDGNIAYSHDSFERSPGNYAVDVGWVGDDVRHAHCVKLDAREIALLAERGANVAHCQCSNIRLGRGIAPVGNLVRAGDTVVLDADGSAINDSGHFINEARQAVLLQRFAWSIWPTRAWVPMTNWPPLVFSLVVAMEVLTPNS